VLDVNLLGFEFNGARVAANTYGYNYINEFIRVIDTFAPANVQAILEWGSGLTSQVLADYAVRQWKSELLLTIDDNEIYQKSIFAAAAAPACVSLKTINLTGLCRSQEDPELNYSTFPLALGRKFDLLFIDGRRRVECAFIASLLAHEASIIIMHDYRRARYQPARALFEIVEDGQQFRVMRLHRPMVPLLAETSASVFSALRDASA
jgi:hypothetical protein